MSRHTPGPWLAEPERLYNKSHVAGRGPKVADSTRALDITIRHNEPGRSRTAEANALLIAAAPDMYAAARIVVREFADFENMTEEAARAMRHLRAAVAKAEGRAP